MQAERMEQHKTNTNLFTTHASELAQVTIFLLFFITLKPRVE